MKTNSIFILLVLSSLFSLNAQSNLRFGAKGGINFANVVGDFSEKFTNRTGFHLGGTAEIPVLKKFFFQSELLYSIQGTKNNEFPVDGPLTETKLEYLNIPLLGKYYLMEGLSLMAGPQVGFLLSAKNEITPSGFIDGPAQTYEEDVKKYLNTVDIGMALGAEYRFAFGAFLQMRYIIGLSNINKSSTEWVLGNFYFPDTKNRNRVWQLSAGFSF